MLNSDSRIINFIRFPLACMVVILHSYIGVQGFHISQVKWGHLTGVDIYSLVGITFSHVLTHVAVPVFFFVSGFLFYQGLQQWSWLSWSNKLKRRLKTLLVPYLNWNTIMALITIGIMVLATLLFGKPVDRIRLWFEEIGGVTGIYWSNLSTGVVKENMLGYSNHSFYPLLMPMWFVRDLMVVVVISPIIYFFLKKTSSISLILIGLFWILGIGTNIPGLSFASLFFFMIGGAFSLRNISFSETFKKVNKPVLILLFVVLGLASIFFDGRSTAIGQIVLSLWILVALVSVVKFARECIERHPFFSETVTKLADTTYFVFAFHGVIIIYVHIALWKLFGVQTQAGSLDATYIANHPWNGIVSYLFTPCLTIAISLTCYWIVKKCLRKWSWLLIGK